MFRTETPHWVSRVYNHKTESLMRLSVVWLTVLAILFQTTVPYLLAADCPLFQMGSASVARHCGENLSGANNAGKKADQTTHHKVTACSLCEMLSSFHKVMLTDIVFLKEPSAYFQLNSLASNSALVKRFSSGSFSARAPPSHDPTA